MHDNRQARAGIGQQERPVGHRLPISVYSDIFENIIFPDTEVSHSTPQFRGPERQPYGPKVLDASVSDHCTSHGARAWN